MNFGLKNQSGFTLLELVYVISIISVLMAILVPQILVQRSRVVEVSAQRRLRSIGSVMSEYSLSRQEGAFTDFQELRDAHMISVDITLSNFIVDYSLAITRSVNSPGASGRRYTVIAYPKAERSQGRLSTFAITEDNMLRVYRPGVGVSPNDPHTWDPVL